MMMSRILFSFIFIFCCICLFNSYYGYAQEPQESEGKIQKTDAIKSEYNQDGMFSKALIEKLSEEDLVTLVKKQIEKDEDLLEVRMDAEKDLLEARMDGQENLLEAELKYYKDSGIPRFLTPQVAIWSSIFAFITIIAIVAIPVYFRHKKVLLLFDTINTMAVKGVEIPPELLVSLQTTRKKRSRLAIGISLSAVGLGVVLFFAFITDPDEGIWSIGLIPLFLGIGYLILARLEDKERLSG
jgi:hypothetical protein